MDSFYEEIKEKIMRDPENAFYTEKGIEPLFSAPKSFLKSVIVNLLLIFSTYISCPDGINRFEEFRFVFREEWPL